MSEASSDPAPFLARKGEENVAEGHPFDKLRAGSQTPGNPDKSGPCTPFFISLLVQLAWQHIPDQEVPMIYEYRVYEAIPGKLPELHARFRNHTLKIFERHGFKNIGYWTASVGDYTDRLIYIVGFEDVEQRDRAWAAFFADPEWQRVKAESEADGPLVARIFNSLLAPTDYSPLQ